jgi:hypothetical protein
MTQDKIYRTLEFFKESGRKVHLRIIAGADKGLFRNGFVLDVSLAQKCFVFVDDVLGERPYLFEEVDENSIVPYREEGR